MLPFVLLIVLIVWQLAVAGQAAWLTASAARSAARAKAVGENPESAARSALPKHLEKGMLVQSGLDSESGSKVRVRVRVPLLIHSLKTPLTVSSAADLPRQVEDSGQHAS